ncbi:MAG: hypothetical protein VXW32_13150 [Myxococcota bacterium]|nr:hypothetical protein [Myxococcota bacterium]
MDKSKKLKRYLRKDYSQSVSFPVEIVGRDGLVRQYSFSESVRLYQRRIASSELRYHDPEISRAESIHCLARIRQLRRSYFQHFGWDSIRGCNPGEELSGEVVAFLLRYLHQEPDGLTLERVKGSAQPVWILQGLPALEGCLLYLYRFEGVGPCESREAFFSQIRHGQVASGVEIERVVAFHHTSDCGLVLTGRGESFLPTSDMNVRAMSWVGDGSEETPRDAFQVGVQCLSNGDAKQAMAHFDVAIAQNPYRHQVHACVVAVCDYLERPEELAIAVRVGLHYFPKSSSLHYMAALARYRRQDWAGVRKVLEGNPEIAANFPARHRALVARLALRAGKWREAYAALRPKSSWSPTEVDALLRQGPLKSLLRRRQLFTAFMATAGVVAIGTLALMPSLSAGLGVLAVACAYGRERAIPLRIEHHLQATRRYLGLGLPKDLTFERDRS